MASTDRRKEVRDGTTIGAFSTALIFLMLSTAIPSAAAQSGNSPPSPYMDAKLTPSMAIIIVILIAAMFFMGFFSIYIRHCNRGSGGSIRAVVGAVAGRSRRARGLDADALEALPTFLYSEVQNLKIGKGALECAVCLNEFTEDETLRLLPKCDHVFHADCIDAWFASHTTCPVCRANLADAVPGESDPAAVDTEDPIHDEQESQSNSTTVDPPSEAVVVPVTSESPDQRGEAAMLPPRPTPPARSWSMKKPRFLSKFPRSHSTGHSLSVVQPGEDCERFTLRLPEGFRKQLVNRSMNQAAGLAMLPRQGSSRKGYRGGEGSSRGARNYRRLDRVDRERSVKSDRWAFIGVPPFFSRASSLRSPRVAADGEGSSSSAVPKAVLTAVKAPLNLLGSKKSGDAESARLPV